jgi:SAM-dependent methyltransferase
VSPPRATELGTLAAEGPNAEQIEFWNETLGPRWAAVAPQLDAQVASFGVWGMERAKVAGGESVLDVGMLALARERASAAKIANVRFVNADAQVHTFEASRFDLVYSRFGVMFFANPSAAFANLRRALKPGGRLSLVCWQALDRNPWMREPLASLAGLIELPAPSAPGAPGPFAFADAERVRAILEAAGFARVAFESAEHPISIGGEGTLDEAVAFLLEVGPVAAVLRDKGDAERRAATALLRDVLERHSTPNGVVMDAAAWIVTAEDPG